MDIHMLWRNVREYQVVLLPSCHCLSSLSLSRRLPWILWGPYLGVRKSGNVLILILCDYAIQSPEAVLLSSAAKSHGFETKRKVSRKF